MRYFFHLEDGACIRDPKGVDFPDDATALIEAANIARELSREHGLKAHAWRVVVQNADGVRIGSVPLSAALGAHEEGDNIPLQSVH